MKDTRKAWNSRCRAPRLKNQFKNHTARQHRPAPRASRQVPPKKMAKPVPLRMYPNSQYSSRNCFFRGGRSMLSSFSAIVSRSGRVAHSSRDRALSCSRRVKSLE